MSASITTTPPARSTAADVAALVERLSAPQVVELQDDGRHALVLPAGLKAHSIKQLLAEYKAHPERPRGTATFTALESFVAWVNRQKLGESALFANADMERPSLTAVLNYHQPGADHTEMDGGVPGWSDHRGTYQFPLSKAWKAWARAESAGLMDQAEFARFLEDRITDVIIPPADGRAEADAKLLDLVAQLGGTLGGPSKLLELSRGLQVHENSVVKSATNLATGEGAMIFETGHQDASGEQLKVPNMFLIGIPVFEMGAAYRLPVRLRYRLAGGKVKWAILRHRPELIFEHAFTEAVEVARTGTELPLFIGAPEI